MRQTMGGGEEYSNIVLKKQKKERKNSD